MVDHENEDTRRWRGDYVVMMRSQNCALDDDDDCGFNHDDNHSHYDAMDN